MYASNVPLPPYPVRVLQGGPGVGVPFHSPLLHPLSGGGGGWYSTEFHYNYGLYQSPGQIYYTMRFLCWGLDALINNFYF